VRALTTTENRVLAAVAFGSSDDGMMAAQVARLAFEPGRAVLPRTSAAAKVLVSLFWIGLVDITADRPVTKWTATRAGCRALLTAGIGDLAPVLVRMLQTHGVVPRRLSSYRRKIT
jgi:hypothetical protein